MRIRHVDDKIIVTGLFSVLYTPLSLALWYETGRTASLSVIMLIGLLIILGYLVVESLLQNRRKRIRRTYIELYEEPELIEDESPEPDLEGFRQLFSDKTSGGEAI